MNDVKRKVEFAAESEKQMDRFELGFIGPGVKIGFVMTPIGICQFFGGGFNRARQLGMNQQREARPGEMREGCAQLLLGNHGEAVDSRIDEETLKARNARSRERTNIPLIVGDNASPEHPVDHGRFLGAATLSLECFDGGSRRQTIEGHVRDERVAPGRSSASARGKALPFGATWFIEVDVRIDKTWKNGSVAKIGEVRAFGNLTRRNDSSDYLFVYE